MGILRQWVASALAFLLVAYLLPGFQVRDVIAALVASAVLGLLNALVRPILALLTLPLTVVTLGLFWFVLNGLIIWSVGWFVPGFHVSGVLTAILAPVLISVAGGVFNGVLKALIK